MEWQRKILRNEETRRRCGLQRSFSERVNVTVLRWFGRIKRMEAFLAEERLVKKKYRADVDDNYRGEVIW